MGERGYISLKTKLAAAICVILEIPHEHQLLMHEDQVLSLVHWDHYPIRKADGGPDEFHNICARTIRRHQKKTAEIDIPQMAKSRRCREEAQRHRNAMLTKLLGTIAASGRPRPKRKIPSRPFSKGKRSVRGFR